MTVSSGINSQFSKIDHRTEAPTGLSQLARCGSLGSPLMQRRNNPVQREVRLLADEGEDLARMLLQWRVFPPRGMGSEVLSSRKRCTHRIAELILTSNCSTVSVGILLLPRVNDAHSQLTRIRSMHWPGLRRINAFDSLLPRILGIPNRPPLQIPSTSTSAAGCACAE
jgi:hypothetical protein